YGTGAPPSKRTISKTQRRFPHPARGCSHCVPSPSTVLLDPTVAAADYLSPFRLPLRLYSGEQLRQRLPQKSPLRQRSATAFAAVVGRRTCFVQTAPDLEARRQAPSSRGPTPQ